MLPKVLHPKTLWTDRTPWRGRNRFRLPYTTRLGTPPTVHAPVNKAPRFARALVLAVAASPCAPRTSCFPVPPVACETLGANDLPASRASVGAHSARHRLDSIGRATTDVTVRRKRRRGCGGLAVCAGSLLGNGLGRRKRGQLVVWSLFRGRRGIALVSRKCARGDFIVGKSLNQRGPKLRWGGRQAPLRRRLVLSVSDRAGRLGERGV
mmetsp:Transcript_28420/g.69140  ORF Transcript_28420/g.69140 Transcript_28420/m.69140 type:complete len:209 (+) Transcript_28420:1120-1746(+)